MQISRTKVVVAGAGPVGSVAASLLAQQGIDVILLEAGPDNAADLRASTFHPPTLELLDRIGIADPLINRGLKAPVYHFRERQSGEVVEFDLSELADATRYPFRIQCEQYHLSRMLSEAVDKEQCAEVRFNNRVVGLHQNSTEVQVYVETPTAIERVDADFLIGADGSNSLVRKWLTTDFTGFTYPEKFLCFSTPCPLDEKIPNLSYVNYVSDPEEWMVLLRVPSLWRVLVPASNEQSDEELLGDEKKIDVFDRLVGDGANVETKHRTIYRVHQRVVNEFVHGRVILAGDAAHLNNPIGGFGMNSGIHDVFNLCDKLVKIYGGGDAGNLLSKYGRQRFKTTHDFIQAQTIRNMEYLKEGSENEHALRKAELEAIKADPVQRRDFLLRQSMIQCLKQEELIE
ncbi:MAG: NAD(P)/FAD-dependent oxidoreductase [Erythrobacter sp.]